MLRALAGAGEFECRSKKRAEDFTRNRKMGFKSVLYFILNMIHESTQNALERYFAVRGEDTYMSQQAFSLARQKIKWEAFREMFDYGVNVHYANYEDEIQRWHGWRIFAVDGSKLTLPADKELRAYFGTSGAGNTSPTAQGSLLYDILNNVVADARIEPMATDERTLAGMHIKRLVELESFREWQELLVFDRGYPSFELVRELGRNKIHYLMRVREKFSVEMDRLPRGDHRMELAHGEQRIPVRVIKFRLDSGETETLITDIDEERYGVKTFKRLYFRRWPVETKYDELKKKLEIENFSGRLVDNIRQDFYATMVLTNLAADFFEAAQELVEKRQQESDNKYHYQINVNHEIGVLKDRLIKTLLEEDGRKREKMFDGIVTLLQKRLTPIRPDRSFPRTTPRKARFHHNHKSNC